MISNILLMVAISLTLISYIRLIVIYLSNQKEKTTTTSSELVLKILDNENSIHLIESKESYFSKYNIQRKMVKLSSNTYDSTNPVSKSVAALLAGYALSDNSSLKIISKVFKEIRIISTSPILAIAVSIFTTNMGDAKISIIILIIIATYQYLLNSMNVEAMEKVNQKGKTQEILLVISQIITVFFISTLIQIIRLVVILLNMR